MILNSLIQETHNVSGQLEVRYQTRITDYELPQEEEKPAQVLLNDGTSLSADLIVSVLQQIFIHNFICYYILTIFYQFIKIGADGFRSGLRGAMKSQYLSRDYDQMGVVATLRLSESEVDKAIPLKVLFITINLSLFHF